MTRKGFFLYSVLVLLVPVLSRAQGSLPAPTLVSPPDGSQVTLSQIRSQGLEWEPVPGAHKYEIEITGPLSFNNGFPYTTSTVVPRFVFGQGGAIDTTFMGTYYWRVRAVFDELGEGGEGSFSQTWRFVVTTPPSPTPTPFMPPAPNLDRNADEKVDYRDLFYWLVAWSVHERGNLPQWVPHFGRRNVTPTPTPTPPLATPSGLRVILDAQPVPPESEIPTGRVGDIVLDWEDVTAVPPVTYDLSIIGPNPQSAVSYYQLTRSEVRPYEGYQGLYPGVYTWTVQAVDGLGRRSGISVERFRLAATAPPPRVVDPATEPEYDLDSDGSFQATDLFSFSRFWSITETQAEYIPQADYNSDGVIAGSDASRLATMLAKPQLPAPQFTTIDIYDPPRGTTPPTFNRTIPAMPPLALKIFELAFCEIHFEPVPGAVDYEVTLTGVTSIDSWPIGSRFTTGGQPSITFMLANRYAPTSPGSYQISVRAIDPRGVPGMRSILLDVVLSSY